MVPNTLQIDPKHLQDWWPFVKQGLTAVHKKTKPYWLIEDVFSAVRGGSAILLISFSGTTPIGFTVSYFTDIPFTSKRELFVWVAFTLTLAERTGLDIPSAIAHNFSMLRNIAKSQGAFRIACISPRKGFAKWAKQFGLEQSLVTYVAPL